MVSWLNGKQPPGDYVVPVRGMAAPQEKISGVTIDFDSPEGCFMDMMNEQGAFINIELIQSSRSPKRKVPA